MAITGSQGARVGNYVLVRQLGVGGMAEVWLVRHQSGAQLRAMKFLNTQFSGIPEVEARFQAEGETQLIHPNIVRIYEVGQQDGSSFMVMDFIEGRDLEKIMDSRRGPLKIPEAVDIGIQILAGLGYAHASGIVHRDIKPSNVLVDDEGQAYLMDFGIAKVLKSSRSVTQVNARLGTPDYMSPEQIRSSRDVDARSDIYSFGCLFYELLTGWPPFDSNTGYESVHDIQTAHVTVAPTAPMHRRNGLPPELDAVVMHCLQKAKEDRPQTCEEIIVVLDAYRASVARGQQPRATTPVRTPTEVDRPGLPSLATTNPGATVPLPGNWAAADPVITNPGSTNPGSTNPGSSSPAPVPYPGHIEEPAPAFPVALPPPESWGFQKYPPPGPSQPAPPAAPPRTTVKPDYGPPVRTPTITDAPAPARPVQLPVSRFQPVATSQPVPAKSSRMMLMAAGILLVLAAAGGGAWAFLHKTEPVPAPPKHADATPPGTQIPAVQPKENTPTSPRVPHGGSTIVKPPVPTPKPPAPAKLASGIITWTGTINNPGQQMVDVYISNRGASAGSVSLASAPAAGLPIAVTVDSGNAMVLNQPGPDRSYSTFRIAVRGIGAQTVQLHWKELPHGDATRPIQDSSTRPL